jgi:hypothetical protein
MADLAKTSLTWNGLTIGAGTRYRMLTLEGWEELPASRYDKQPRANAHGAHPTPVYADERIVGVEGYCWDSTDRDQLLSDLRAFLTFADDPDEDTEPLAVTAAGKTLTAGAQLITALPKLTRGEWGVGRFGWLLQWRCPDPRRYGAPQTAPTGLPSASGGLTYPLAYPLAYGTVGVTGRITLTNPGTAPAPILLQVTGAHDVGWEVSAVETGQRLTYPVPVPAGQTIELDTAAGTGCSCPAATRGPA